MITFITPLLQGDSHTQRTFESLADVLGEEVHWLVKYSSPVFNSELSAFAGHSFVRLVLMQDENLYTGLNQALEFVETPYFAVLGSGDRVVPDVVRKAVTMLRDRSNLLSCFYSIYHEAKSWHFKARPQELPFKMSCPHPGAILQTAAARTLGGFDTRYKIAADYDLLCRFLKKFPETTSSDDIFVNFMGHGISSKSPGGFIEEELIRFRLFGRPFQVVRA